MVKIFPLRLLSPYDKINNIIRILDKNKETKQPIITNNIDIVSIKPNKIIKKNYIKEYIRGIFNK